MCSVNADTAMSRRFQTYKMGSVCSFNLSLSVTKIMRPCTCILNLLHGEHSFRSLHIARFFFISQGFATGHRISCQQLAAKIVQSQCHRLLGDNNKCCICRLNFCRSRNLGFSTLRIRCLLFGISF